MNKKYNFGNIEIPIYFFVENNKVMIDIKEMKNGFYIKMNELIKKFE